jgi:hypothetical protein
VSLRQDRGQHETERLLLADHGPADLAQHLLGDGCAQRR